MGNGVGKLNLCFAGDGGEISQRRQDIAVCLNDHPLDEGLGHSFCYIRSEPTSNPQSVDDFAAQTTAFPSISGAAISANAFTPLSTDPFTYINGSSSLDKAAAFESSHLFSSIPLQPIPKNSVSSVKSGPISRNPVPNSGPISRHPALGSAPIERGFLSGPIERSFISGPLENQFDQLQRFKPKPKKWALIKNLKRMIHKSLWKPSNGSNTATASGNSSSTIASHNLSSQQSIDDNDDVVYESFDSENLQWAQGKAGEDRVHIVVFEEHGFVFVGIYDGFSGPDATDFLLNNLYPNVSKELKGLLWFDKLESLENTITSSSSSSKHLDSDSPLFDHLAVLKALSEALKKTEASYLQIADMMLMENPELSLMGSCVLAMVMKGDDIYIMNVGDSRAVLAQTDSQSGKTKNQSENSFYGYEYENVHNLSSFQLTMDHSTSIEKEVRRIKNAHPDDSMAIHNDRVKGSLKVTRAFGAGFLKQPKWNNALLEMFRIDYIGTLPYITCCPSLCHHRLQSKDKFLILSSDGLYQYFTNQEAISEVETFMLMFPEGDPAQHLVEEVLFRAAKKAGMDFHELLGIPQGDRRRYHDDVSIIIISFEGKIWSSV